MFRIKTSLLAGAAVCLLAGGCADSTVDTGEDEEPEAGPGNYCGDGEIDGDEVCDDGVNDGSYNGCAEDCLALGPYCGDGVTNGPEDCDDANVGNGDACLAGCVAASCGDGFVWVGEEACDDGVNDGSYDGCDPGCDSLGPHCGDGVTNGPEDCDDGAANGIYDGCAEDCSGLGPHCGDGVVQEDEEQCDDGNDADTDACLTTCEDATCGDGFLWEGEEACDDGENDGSYGGCAEDCLELGPHCGDGEVNGEDPDDLLDGGVPFEEECDDADTDNTDECPDTCLDAFCGDGYVWDGEELCDDGVNDGAYGGCEPGCDVLGPHCGDAIVNGPEVCDDGINDGSYDGCAVGCLEWGPYCGDGVTDTPEEECDDANDVVGDGCTAECLEEYCGDELVGWSRPFDGFETGDLSQLPWVTGTAVGMNGPFAVSDTPTPHDGSYLLATASPSPGAFDDTRAYIEVALDVVADGEICFWYSGEGSIFNEFRFSVDGTAELSVADGTDTPWTEFCAAVSAGTGRAFLWEYEQSWMAEGLAFYLDDVRFPLHQEQCDDGNSEIDDGCNTNCLEE